MKHTVPIVLIAVFCLAGCVSVKPLTTPSGRQGFHLNCGGTGADWSTCYEEATKRCKGPYTIVDRSQDRTFTPYGPLINREMIIECPAWIFPNASKPAG